MTIPEIRAMLEIVGFQVAIKAVLGLTLFQYVAMTGSPPIYEIVCYIVSHIKDLVFPRSL